jgi:glucose/arabinose dehydrogenase
MTGRSGRLRAATLALVAALVLAGCTFGAPDRTQEGEPPNLPPPPSPSAPSAPEDDSVGVQVLAKNLAVPWGVGFLPNGDALVTERDSRRIIRVSPGGRVTPVTVIEEAYSGGEGGLMGLAVSPTYARDSTVYIYYTTRTDNRIARLVPGTPPAPIVTGIPVSGIHNGGRIAFGPDGYLYAGTGDASRNGLSQNPKSLGGKILRMTPAGKPAPGNPIPGSLVWSIGHRNVQGLAWDEKKRLWAAEFGQNKVDEINLIRRGGNYGWPTVEGIGRNPRFVDPLVTWPTSEASPSGIAIVGNLLVAAALRGKRLWVVTIDPATGRVADQPTAVLVGRFGRLRTVIQAPDGSLWITTSNRDGRGEPTVEDDRIIRIVPPGDSGVSVL